MASNRFSAGQVASAATESADTPRAALSVVAFHAARVQIAAVSAAGTVIAGWAQAGDRFVQAVGDELLRRVDGETDSRELIVGVAAATRVHLRELTTLPRAAADHFDTRLAHESTDI
jgi:hypothetical protein